jgi:damage-control phosphatase, subfamily I
VEQAGPVNTRLDCFPCFVRQALDAARFVTDDVQVHRQVLGEVLRQAASLDLDRPPVVVGQAVHRRLRQVCRDDDPYRAVKAQHHRLVADVLAGLAEQVRQAPDPLLAAARLAIAANAVDLGIPGAPVPDRVQAGLREALRAPFHGDIEAFRLAVAAARDVLYLADNAGELTVDRLLIDQIGPERVTVAVRGGPVVNDATMPDAVLAGITALVPVGNGSDAPGTVLQDCSPLFRDRLRAADLVIAKGQGKFETLDDVEGPIFFLFKVKCPVVAERVDLPLGTHVLLRSPRCVPVTDEVAVDPRWDAPNAAPSRRWTAVPSSVGRSSTSAGAACTTAGPRAPTTPESPGSCATTR